MLDYKQIPLCSSEIGQLWVTYYNNSMGICLLKHFFATAEDQDIKAVVQYALKVSESIVETTASILKAEKFPLPYGYSDKDVNLYAPKLYSDIFILEYLKNLGGAGIVIYGLSATVSPRSDIRDLFNQCISSSKEILNKASNILLEKGRYIRSPKIPTPQKAEFVQEGNLFDSYYDKDRSLNAIEINNLFLNSLRNGIGRALLIGYSQVAETEDVKQFLVRGRNMAGKHMEIFHSLLQQDNLPDPVNWDSEVSDSKIAPFSEKLMLNHTVLLIATGIGNYGMAIATSPRRDLALTFTRLSAEVAIYSKSGADLLIKKDWLEKIPECVDRDALIRS